MGSAQQLQQLKYLSEYFQALGLQGLQRGMMNLLCNQPARSRCIEATLVQVSVTERLLPQRSVMVSVMENCLQG
jgi:hypothetical protein